MTFLEIIKNRKIHNHELQRNFFASLEIPNLGRYVENKKMTFDNDILKNQNVVS